MKISLTRGELLDALSVVSRGLSSRSTLPILSGILVSTSADRVDLHATDLEVSVRSSAQARVDKAGSAVIPGKLVADIVRTMPEAAVTIETGSGSEASITCAQSSFTVRTLPAEDFPRFPEVSPDKTVELPSKILSSVVKQVSRAASRDETSPLLTGVLVVMDGASLKMVATDRYRLASRQEILETPSGEPVEVIVPSRALDEVTRLVGDEGSITIGVSENQISFEFGRTLYISRRIEGTFPNYSALLPKSFETTVTVERSELIDTVKRVGLLAQHNAPIRCKVSDSTLTLSAKTQDVGEATEDLMVSTEGEMGVEIALNPGFLADALSAPTTERISIGMNGSVKPAVITPIGGEDFLYLIMPVRLG